MQKNEQKLKAISKLKIGLVVAVPHSVFPNEPVPEGGCWMGKTVSTTQGGTGDIGIWIPGEDVFTRPRFEVADWLVEE